MYLQGLNFLRITCKIVPQGDPYPCPFLLLPSFCAKILPFPSETNGFKNFSIKSKDCWKQKSF